MNYWLIMPAAGAGRRFGAALPKQYAQLLGGTVLEWALSGFIADPRCSGIVVAVAPEDPWWPQVAPRLPSGVVAVAGGAERSESVLNGLRALGGRAQERDWVLVHDAARPCLSAADLGRLLGELAEEDTGGLLASPGSDTLKYAPPGGPAVERTMDRTGLWRALTPQMFRYGALRKALEAAHDAGRTPTDESQALEWVGARPRLVEGSAANIKVTTAQDLVLAAAILTSMGRVAPLAGAPDQQQRTAEQAMRIGSGFDVHAFGAGEFVMLGGVRVPYGRGVIAHSDGDVILHALCDALLGAAGLGDIGQHFRDDDPQWRNADSKGFVRGALAMLRERDLAVINADITVLAEAPRLSAHREQIRRSIATLLEVEPDCVNVKATTTEKMGFLGRGEGLAAQAVVLLRTRS
ncbi:MAG TPA: 2-C-methyl-D-erythritol 4-phosphate cytidylyltransferase [Steroidobacteraceae bacterium]|nr:2-C-methyl-D-erythritol 4-phosphate cytidylyltransferase [Steroidobacteraceae bacterium]